MDIRAEPFKVLSLCTGGYGLDLGLELAVENARTVCAVEVEAYCQKKLVEKIEKGLLPPFPIWSDVRTFNANPWREKVDCVIGGYPCQPFSIAGKQKGSEDPRHLWSAIARIVRDCRPKICFFENVGEHLRLGFEQVDNDLRSMGYQVKTAMFTASEVGAPHKRERQFILGYSKHTRPYTTQKLRRGFKASDNKSQGSKQASKPKRADRPNCDEGLQRCEVQLANSDSKRLQRDNEKTHSARKSEKSIGLRGNSPFPPKPNESWENIPDDLKPAIHRMADGLAERVDEIRMHGNGVVPLQAAHAFLTLWHELER